MTLTGKWFYGNEVSAYGQENGYLDYRTLAKAFDAVLNNDIMQQTDAAGLGYWEQESGFVDNSDEIDKLRDQIDELQDKITMDSTEEEDAKTQEQIDELQERIDELESEQDEQPEIFQFYIISDQGAEILKEAGEIVFYNAALDMYVWGVTHYGTAWDYVLTNVKINTETEAA